MRACAEAASACCSAPDRLGLLDRSHCAPLPPRHLVHAPPQDKAPHPHQESPRLSAARARMQPWSSS
eukprot:3098338-Rhodomonas_salina.1